MKGHTYSKRRRFNPLFATRRSQNNLDMCANRCNEMLAINNAFISASKLKVGKVGINSHRMRAAAKRANRGFVSHKVYK